MTKPIDHDAKATAKDAAAAAEKEAQQGMADVQASPQPETDLGLQTPLEGLDRAAAAALAAEQAAAEQAAAAALAEEQAAAEQEAIAEEIAEREAAEKAAADQAEVQRLAAEQSLADRTVLPDFDDQFSKLQDLVDLITDNLPFNQTAVRADLELRYGALTTERHDLGRPDVFDMTCQGITVELCIGEKAMLENWAMAARRVLLARPMVA